MITDELYGLAEQVADLERRRVSLPEWGLSEDDLDLHREGAYVGAIAILTIAERIDPELVEQLIYVGTRGCDAVTADHLLEEIETDRPEDAR